jgi:hypothetical protein
MIVWDTPADTSYIFRLTPHSWSSDSAIRSTFAGIVRQPGEPNAARITGVALNVARDAATQQWIGSGGIENPVPPRRFDAGKSNWFDLWETPTASFISITLNRQLPQPIPERFPPLVSRVGAWSVSRLLDELTRNTGAARDSVLARELLTRDPTNDEFLDLLESRRRYENGVVLAELVAAHQVARFEAAIRQYLRHDFLGYYPVTSAFRIVDRSGVDFTDVAMEVLRENSRAEGAFWYAAVHGSPTDYRALKDLPRLSVVFQTSRDIQLREMRARLRLDEEGTPLPH